MAEQPDPAALKARLEQIAMSENLADSVDDETLTELGRDVVKHYDIDKASMGDWTERMNTALDLAMMVKEDKTYPWSNASNVIFPLITSAALQYNARAYPAIVPSTDVVKVKVHGNDPQGQKAARAQRVAQFSTWQLKTDSREWERGTDQLLLQLPIVGDMFRKMWFDPEQQRVRTQVRMPGRQVVVNNNATSIHTAPRVSDLLELYPYQIESRIRAGLYLDPEDEDRDEDDQKPVEFIEQHTRSDLDGDGYPEPYIVTVHKEKEKVVRIVAGFEPDDVRINMQTGEIVAAEQSAYFIHYQFMPSMDGGLFGTGLGLLLGDVSETINSTINQIMDAGHMASLGGGFIAGRDFRVQGGTHRRRPGEYKQVNFYGDDIRKGIVDLQHPGPSNVLFEMLGLMIDAGREIASVKDVMTGDSGRQNMPVGTVMALIEQGQMVFTASYKRVYRALKSEFALLAGINRKNLDPEKYNRFLDDVQADEQGQAQPVMHDPAEDFDLRDMDIEPVADPNSVTSMQKMGRAQFLYEMAKEGMLDPAEAMSRVLDAANVEDIPALLPKPDPTAGAMKAAEQEMMVVELKLKEADVDKTIAETQAKMASAMKDVAEIDRADALEPLQKQIDQFKAMKEALDARRAVIEAGRPGAVEGKSGN